MQVLMPESSLLPAVAPDPPPDVLARDQLTCALDQKLQNGQRLRLYVYERAATAQIPRLEVKHERAESDTLPVDFWCAHRA
jgi:hypothetical protein